VSLRGAFAVALLASALPGATFAHDAFGDMGPFYANLLHPAADPAQGVVLAGAAAFLARQPIATVRPAYAALAIGGAAAALAATLGAAPGLSPLVAAILACLLGGGAIVRIGFPVWAAAPLAGAAGVAAGFALTTGPGLRDMALGLLGGALGVALAQLLLWGVMDFAVRRIGAVAVAVIGAWVAAVGIMTAALGT
jgi:hypothetical protein